MIDWAELMDWVRDDAETIDSTVTIRRRNGISLSFANASLMEQFKQTNCYKCNKAVINVAFRKSKASNPTTR